MRRLAPDDDAASAGFFVQQAYLRLPGYPIDPDYDARLADVRGRAHEADVIVAELDGRLVGCLTFLPSHDNPHSDVEDPEATSFRYFGVDPEVQRRGVGEAMVRWCIDETRRLGKRRILIHTLESMPGAQRLYLRVGFERRPDIDGYWDGILGVGFGYEIGEDIDEEIDRAPGASTPPARPH